MGAALFVVLERPIDGIDPCATNGKALARYSDELDAVADELNVTPLGQLFSMSADEMEGMLDVGRVGQDELDGLPDELREAVAGHLNEINSAFGALENQIAEHGVPAEEWFEATEGLQTVQRLIGFLQSDQDRIAEPKEVVGELEEIETILKTAVQAGVRFHLGLDI
jgi:hypothetical protein